MLAPTRELAVQVSEAVYKYGRVLDAQVPAPFATLAREAIVRADLVDCIVALPPQLFFTTGIPVCLWFLDANKKSAGERDRSGETLFIDARKLGEMQTRTLRVLTDDNITQISETYHNWRNKKPKTEYEDVAGFCKSASIDEIATHDFVLTPGRYVGAAAVEDDGEPIDEKLTRLRTELLAEFDEADRLEQIIRERLQGLIGG